MKKLIALLIGASVGLFAADRVAQFTSTESRTKTVSIESISLYFDRSNPSLPLQKMNIVYWTSYTDGTPEHSYTESWTREMLESLPTTATNMFGNLATNTFRSGMLARWNGSDIIPDNVLMGLKNPNFMKLPAPVVEEPAPEVP